MTGRDMKRLHAMRDEVEAMANGYDEGGDAYTRLRSLLDGYDNVIHGPFYTVTTERGAVRVRAWSSAQARAKVESEGQKALSVQW